jgi:3-oxoacyl-[acyl-carrier-protein] synthase II
VLAANGIGKDAFWSSLLAGESGIGPITQFDASEIPWNIAGEVDNFSPEDFIDRKLKPRRQSRNTQLAAAATMMALQDAEIDSALLQAASPLHINLGISLGGLDLVEEHTRRIVSKGLNKGLPTVSACVHVIASSFIAAILKVKSKINVISNSCTGGLDAIGDGAAAIRRGETELAIVGGTDAVIVPSVITGLGYAGMLATDNSDPKTASRPFDLHRSGGIASEGAGVILIESYNHAVARGAKQYAEIIGYGSAGSINTLVSTGLGESMNRSILNSGILPRDIAYINAHGSSDPELDLAETVAIKEVFKQHAFDIPVSSIKGSTGNPMAAGGAMQAIATSLAISNSIIPPTTNYTNPDPDCDLDYVPLAPRKMDIPISLINSHGTGGVNSSLVLKKL